MLPLTSSLHPTTYPARPISGGPFTAALRKWGIWTYEPKYNGWRALIHVVTGRMFNRHGEQLSIEHEFTPALNILRTTLDAQAFEWVDCEALERRHNIGRGTLILLDVIPSGRNTVTHEHWTYEQRRSWITPDILPVLEPVSRVGQEPEDNAVYQSPRIAEEQAADYWSLLQIFNQHCGCPFYEGLVAKRNDSKYPIQLRSPDEKFPYWVKHRWAY